MSFLPQMKVPILKIEGIELSYFDVPFDDGTPCDLTGNPGKPQFGIFASQKERVKYTNLRRFQHVNML